MPNPIKLSLKTEVIPLLAIVASLIFGIYFYLHFPAVVVTHWGFNGQPNGYRGKFFAAFFVPMLIVGMYLLFLDLPFFDPKRERYGDFENVYHLFKATIIF